MLRLLMVIAAIALVFGSRTAGGETLEVPISESEWKPVLTLERLGRSQYSWSASVRNPATESRKVCVAFDLLDAKGAVLSTSVRCLVLPAKGQAIVDGDAYVESSMIEQVKSHRAVAMANPIYYPSTPVVPTAASPTPTPAAAAKTEAKASSANRKSASKPEPKTKVRVKRKPVSKPAPATPTPP